MIEHIFFHNIGLYLNEVGIKPEDFQKYLLEKNTKRVVSIVSPLFSYGYFHVVLPLHELVIYSMDEDHVSWWKQEIINNYLPEELYEALGIFHSLIYRVYENNKCDDGTYIQEIHIIVDAQTIRESVWESYADLYDQLIHKNPDLVGLIIPRLSYRHIDQQCIDRMNNNYYPQLKKLLEDDAFLSTRAIRYLEMGLFEVSVFLNEKYNYVFRSKGIAEIQQMTEAELCSLKSYEYADLIFQSPHSGEKPFIPVTASTEWIENLKYTYRMRKKLNKEEQLMPTGRMAIPVLYQCMDANEKACSSLLEIMDEMNIRSISESILVTVIYRAISKERFEANTKLRRCLCDILGKEVIPESVYELCEDTLRFFEAFSKDYIERFYPEILEEKIQKSDYENSFFYEKYKKSDLLKKYHPEMYWIREEYFVNERITKTFHQYISEIKTPTTKYRGKLIHIYQFFELFKALVSHLYDKPRINIQYCNRCLAIKNPELKGEQYEVFDVYSPRQVEKLKNLMEIWLDINNKLPDLNAVYFYERIKYAPTNEEVVKCLFLLNGDLYKRMDDLEREQRYQTMTHEYFLRYIENDKELKTKVLVILTRNGKLTKKFYEDLIRNNHLEGNTEIQRCLNIVEEAIQNPQIFEREASKKELEKFIELVVDLIPFTGIVKAVRSLQKYVGHKTDEMLLEKR